MARKTAELPVATSTTTGDKYIVLQGGESKQIDHANVFSGAGAGDMLATTYDPTTVSGDAFSMDNMTEGANKILTTAERAAISTNSTKVTYPSVDATKLANITITQAVDLDTIESDTAANNSKVGITPTQAADILTNNAKISGVTDHTLLTNIGTKTHATLDSEVTANNAKTGITAGQASAIVVNTAKVTYPSADSTKLAGIETSATADQTGVEIKTAYENNANTNAYTDSEQIKLSGIEALADVTDTANVTAAGALMDSEVDADIKTLVLPATTTISTFGASLVDDTTAAIARTTLGVDAAGTDNSTDVTVTDSAEIDFTLVGQDITASIIAASIDETKLDASTNTSLNLADNSIQNLVTTTTGLGINVSEFVIHINGADVTIPTESITLPASNTHFIGFDLVDNTVHYLRRNYQDGMIWVAKVTTDATVVTNIEQIHPILPKDRIPKFRETLVNGIRDVEISLIGDSLVEDIAGTGTGWTNKLFDVAEVAFGYNLPSIANVNFDNYAVGSQTAHYGLLWTAKSTKGGTGDFNNTAISYDYKAQADIYSITNQDVLKNTPFFTKMYDLVIIGFGAQSGTYGYAYYETIIKKIREQGIEVIILTENYRTDNATFLFDEADKLKLIADEYGCAIADTWVFVRESDDNGNTVHDGVIHMAEAGKTAYANSVRTIINDKRLTKGNIAVDKGRILKEQSQININGNFPNGFEFDCTPNATTGTLIASAVPDLINPSFQFAGLASTVSVIELSVGEIAEFNHGYASAFDIVIDGSMIGDFEWNEQNGATLKGTFSQGASAGNTPRIVEGSQISIHSTITTNLYNSRAIQIECTSGTCKIYGLLWHTYNNDTITLDKPIYNGSWGEEVWAYNHDRSIYTDTLNDSFTFDFYGSDCLMFFSRRNASGIIDVYLNGELIHDNFDLWVTGGNLFTKHVHVSTSMTTYFDLPPTKNTVTVQYVADNASISASGVSNRRLQLLQIKQFNRQ